MELELAAFKAIATPPQEGEEGEVSNATNSTLKLTTDVNGDGIQASAYDGSEGSFSEKIVKGSIQLSP